MIKFFVGASVALCLSTAVQAASSIANQVNQRPPVLNAQSGSVSKSNQSVNRNSRSFITGVKTRQLGRPYTGPASKIGVSGKGLSLGQYSSTRKSTPLRIDANSQQKKANETQAAADKAANDAKSSKDHARAAKDSIRKMLDIQKEMNRAASSSLR